MKACAKCGRKFAPSQEIYVWESQALCERCFPDLTLEQPGMSLWGNDDLNTLVSDEPAPLAQHEPAITRRNDFWWAWLVAGMALMVLLLIVPSLLFLTPVAAFFVYLYHGSMEFRRRIDRVWAYGGRMIRKNFFGEFSQASATDADPSLAADERQNMKTMKIYDEKRMSWREATGIVLNKLQTADDDLQIEFTISKTRCVEAPGDGALTFRVLNVTMQDTRDILQAITSHARWELRYSR